MKKKLAKAYLRKRRAVAKKSKFLLKHPLIIPVLTFIVLFISGLAFLVAVGGSTQGAADARIVNVYVDGDQQTVTTRAKDVADLLSRMDISLADEDIVEPAKDTLILEDDTQVNIYRARPVEIVDNGRVRTLLTAQRAPRLVVAEAGVHLVPEDKAEFARTDESVLETAIAERIVVERSVEVKLNVFGAIKIVRSTADSVKELLDEQQVSPSLDETVQPDMSSPLKENMLISVNRPGVKTVAVNENIPFTVETKDSADIQAGKTEVEKAGVNGERAVIYEIEEKDGVEVGRKEIQQVVLKNPENEIRLRGTKIVAPAFSSGVSVAGDKAALMAAAGIPESDYAYVDYIISKESRWSPGAVNSSSGAYGLCQSLPASKMATAGADYLTNPITQLQWCSGYASGRYGGWAGAYSAWQAQNWW